MLFVLEVAKKHNYNRFGYWVVRLSIASKSLISGSVLFDEIDEPICWAVMRCHWSIWLQFRLNFLGKLFSKFNSAFIKAGEERRKTKLVLITYSIYQNPLTLKIAASKKSLDSEHYDECSSLYKLLSWYYSTQCHSGTTGALTAA